MYYDHDIGYHLGLQVCIQLACNILDCMVFLLAVSMSDHNFKYVVDG